LGSERLLGHHEPHAQKNQEDGQEGGHIPLVHAESLRGRLDGKPESGSGARRL
jgi:hypothetical protein